MLAPVQDLQRFSRVESVARTLHIDSNTAVPDAVGQVNSHIVCVGRKLQLAHNAGGFVLVRMLRSSSSP